MKRGRRRSELEILKRNEFPAPLSICPMKDHRISVMRLVLVLLMLRCGTAIAQSASQLPDVTRTSSPASDGISPGTVITTHNWQNYGEFMPEGMAALFDGKYFWKMPPDVQLEVGPTIVNPLPKNYLAATEKYASEVKVIARRRADVAGLSRRNTVSQPAGAS